jgi:hypothetical protein
VTDECRAMDRETAKAGNRGARHPGRGVVLLHTFALVGAGATLLFTAGLDRWSPGPLLVLSAFTILSVVTDVSSGASKVRVSEGMIGLMVAAIFLGPGPAVLLGEVTIVLSWFRSRVAGHVARNNVAVFAWYPLAASLFFHATTHATNLRPHDPAYYLVVFLTFVLALVVNFVGVFTYACYVQRASFVEKARDAFLPVMPAQLFSAALTMAAVWAAVEAGTAGLVLIVLVLLIFQYLVGELLSPSSVACNYSASPPPTN